MAIWGVCLCKWARSLQEHRKLHGIWLTSKVGRQPGAFDLCVFHLQSLVEGRRKHGRLRVHFLQASSQLTVMNIFLLRTGNCVVIVIDYRFNRLMCLHSDWTKAMLIGRHVLNPELRRPFHSRVRITSWGDVSCGFFSPSRWSEI